MAILNSPSLSRLVLTLLLHLTWFLCVFCQEKRRNHGNPPPNFITMPPPPPPPSRPPPSLPPPPLSEHVDERVAVLDPVVQKFKSTVTSDPQGVTSTWVGGNVCKYKGFYCKSPPDNSTATAIAAIDFNGYQLSAPSLDDFVDAFPDLAIFHANTNNFGGTISPKIATLRYLHELDLSNNRFVGEFPPAVLNIPILAFLDIRFNAFSGSIPPQVFLQRLDVLFVNNNNFSQKIPDDFGDTPALYLTFASNNLTGPIPRSIGNTSSTLTEILFLNNSLSGCLPTEIGSLRELTVFDVSDNSLTGPLPSSLGCLYNAEQLNFSGNSFYGKVPEELCELNPEITLTKNPRNLSMAQRNLRILSLSDNYFWKVGPVCKMLIQAKQLDVRNNCIRELPDQRPRSDCAAFVPTRRICPDSASYEKVPCRNDDAQLHSRGPRKLINTEKITYAALQRHRVL